MSEQRTAFSPVKKMLAYERVVEQIEEAIYAGTLMPGDRLPSERDLTDEFNVSRATVREALRVLESNGFIRTTQGGGKGAEVLAYSPDQFAQSIRSLVKLEKLSLPELVFFRMLVEGAITGIAAARRTTEDLKVLEAALRRMEEASEGADDFAAADLEFHDAISEIAANPLLVICNRVVHRSVRNLIELKIASGDRKAENMNEAINRHREAFKAIQQEDSEKAMAVSRRNLYEYYSREMSADESSTLLLLLDEGDE